MSLKSCKFINLGFFFFLLNYIFGPRFFTLILKSYSYFKIFYFKKVTTTSLK